MIYSNIVKFDGSHFIANEARPVYARQHKKKTERDLYFDELYKLASIKFCVTPGLIFNYIKQNIIYKFGETSDLDEYLGRKIEGKEKALYQRRQRFWSKAQLNKFNYFYTQSYDDEKYSNEEEFRSDLKKTMQNLRSRRGWQYIIKWERGDENNRLHSHSLVHIPDKSQLPGITQLKRDYSRRKHRMETRNENSFFADKFGRNDFEPVNTQCGGKTAIQYIGKYLEKTDDNVTYSRGLATTLDTKISDTEVIAHMECIKKKADVVSVFLRYVTYDFVSYSPLVRWYRKDNIPIAARAG